MKISNCSNKTEDTLSLDQIKLKEGVYRQQGMYAGNARFVVLKQGSSPLVSVIMCLKDTLEPLREENWTSARFVRLEGASVCFEIKE